jgi:hypothetical protein
MSNVRPFRRDDVPEVAELYKEVFLFEQDTNLDDLKSYFETVYFDHPYFNEDIPSLVHRGSEGDVTAFLGIMSTPMRFRDEKIKVAIGGNLMVKGARYASHRGDHPRLPNHGNQRAPFAIAKVLMKLPYDLYLGDSATDVTMRMWEHVGGDTLRLYSLRWLRALKPASMGLSVLGRRPSFRSLTKLARPLGALLDRAARPIIAPEAAALPVGYLVDDIQPQEILNELAKSKFYDLLPDYSLSGLTWILGMAQERRRFGELRSIAVRKADGRLLGWAVFDGTAGDIGHVLQLHVGPKDADQFFQCLFHDAARNGLSALSGKADPLLFQSLTNQTAIMKTNAWTVARTKRPELLQAFHQGKALFSELESEGWTRFMGAHKFEFAPD